MSRTEVPSKDVKICVYVHELECLGPSLPPLLPPDALTDELPETEIPTARAIANRGVSCCEYLVRQNSSTVGEYTVVLLELLSRSSPKLAATTTNPLSQTRGESVSCC